MKEIFKDLMGYCSLQEMDPTKSNDFNKIHTFLKRHHGDATLDEFILSINDIGAMQHNIREKIKSYDQAFFDQLMITILSFGIRVHKVQMKKEVYDSKLEKRVPKNLTLRGVLSEFYEKEQDAGQFTSPDNRGETDFTYILNHFDLSLDSRLKIMDNMMPFVINHDKYKPLDSMYLVWDVYTKRRGNTEHSKCSQDPSFGALLYMITYDLRRSPEMVVRMMTRFNYQIEELISKAVDSSYDAHYYFVGSNAYLSYMSKALACECVRYIGGNLYGGYTTDMITGMMRIMHSLSKMREKYYEHDPGATLYSTDSELQVWFIMVFAYLTRIKYLTPEMNDILEELNRDPRYICGNLRKTLVHTTLQVSQKDGDLSLIYEWLKTAASHDIEGSGDSVPGVTEILTSAIHRAGEDDSALVEIQENFNEILVHRIDEAYSKEEKPKDGAISVLQNDMVCRLLNTFIGAIEYERRRNSNH